MQRPMLCASRRACPPPQMVVWFVTHAANQAHQAVGIGLVHFAMPQGFTCGTEFVAGGDDGDPEARPYRDG